MIGCTRCLKTVCVCADGRDVLASHMAHQEERVAALQRRVEEDVLAQGFLAGTVEELQRRRGEYIELIAAAASRIRNQRRTLRFLIVKWRELWMFVALAFLWGLCLGVGTR